MQTCLQIFSVSFEEKKSTFLAYLCPIDEFETLHVRLKNEHPKAAHIVWAKRFFNEYRQIVENNSDDGEPKGTSGPPVLNVMRGAALIEVGILIVRYFGGIKLGTGGLVRAYGGSAKALIANALIQPYIFKESFWFEIAYPLMPRFEHYMVQHAVEVVLRDFREQGVFWMIRMSEEEKEAFCLFSQTFERDGYTLITQ